MRIIYVQTTSVIKCKIYLKCIKSILRIPVPDEHHFVHLDELLAEEADILEVLDAANSGDGVQKQRVLGLR